MSEKKPLQDYLAARTRDKNKGKKIKPVMKGFKRDGVVYIDEAAKKQKK